MAALPCCFLLLLLAGGAYGAFEMVNTPFGVVSDGDATFYGDQQGNGVDGGNCGYLGLRRKPGNLDYEPYGLQISAASYPLWMEGAGCGACYKVKCVDSPFCLDTSMIVTITDFCPDQGWCDPWKYHFDLGGAAFPKLAQVQAGHFPLKYERVECPRHGPIVLRIMGNPFWLSVLSENVGGAGTTDAMEIQTAGNPDWIPMAHDWGGYFKITGQSFEGPLSVRLTQKLTGQQVVLSNCIPADWTPNTEYTCDTNFGSGAPVTAAAAPSPTDPATSAPVVVPEQPHEPIPIIIQNPTAAEPQTPAPTDAQTPAPTDAQTAAPTNPQTSAPQTPEPTSAPNPQTSAPQTPEPTSAPIAAPVITPVVTSAPATSSGGPQESQPAPVVSAPTPVTTTILQDPTAPVDVTGGNCISWAQGQSSRRLLDSSTVQLCTRVISEWVQGDGTQIAQYQVTIINGGKMPLTAITMGLTNFAPWFDQFWKFDYDSASGTATLPDWQVALGSGQSYEFGYIQAGASGATFSISDVQFAAGAKRRAR